MSASIDDGMTFFDFIIAVPWFAGGLLFWPGHWIFRGGAKPPRPEFKRIFRLTLGALAGVVVLLGMVALLRQLDHNWLPVTLLFPLINLVSIVFSVRSLVQKQSAA
jgi:hypothetical protein